MAAVDAVLPGPILELERGFSLFFYRIMKILTLSFLALQFLTELPLTPMSFDAKELAAAFNQAQDRARVVTVLSPT